MDEVAIQYLEDFIEDRENLRKYLSYDFGARHCISDLLAKLQLQIAWEEIAKAIFAN
jgi:cytochrome P450